MVNTKGTLTLLHCNDILLCSVLLHFLLHPTLISVVFVQQLYTLYTIYMVQLFFYIIYLNVVFCSVLIFRWPYFPPWNWCIYIVMLLSHSNIFSFPLPLFFKHLCDLYSGYRLLLFFSAHKTSLTQSTIFNKMLIDIMCSRGSKMFSAQCVQIDCVGNFYYYYTLYTVYIALCTNTRIANRRVNRLNIFFL